MSWNATAHTLAERDPDDLVDLVLQVELPFVPVAGMMLKLTPEGDLLEVDYVDWDIATPDHINVHFVEPGFSQEIPALGMLLAEGWSLNPLSGKSSTD